MKFVAELEQGGSARLRASRRITLTGLVINTALASLQLLLGWLGRSQALLADGVHTVSDLVTDVLVLWGLHAGAQDADEEHPYGHGRYETVVTVILGMMLTAVAVGIAARAGIRLSDPANIPVPSAWTLVAIFAAIFSKEGLYRYTLRVAKQYDSRLLRANAWHHRSDAISSVIVLLGVGGALLGVTWLDALAAVGVAIMVGRIGIQLAWEAVRELVDTGLESADLEQIREVTLSVDGVKSLHELRTRSVGGRALADLHLLVKEDVSVSEGHHISEAVRHALISGLPALTDVTVHIDPEDDEVQPPSLGLPLRSEMLERIRQRLAGFPEIGQIDGVRLHYLGGRVHVELYLPLAACAEPQRASLGEAFRGAVAEDPVFGNLEVYFH
ncbi:MAG: cation diffusion facilitator family transporter [Gammaproteobacteria bacterium]|nr:cation diffusion facilitator family transporter [Gammaproteobacteria bacterium]